MLNLNLDQIIRAAALRWLHSIDLREGSKTLGVCDREYWAWKTKDFANGTHQAGLSGFLDSLDLFSFSKSEIESLVLKVLKGTNKIQRNNGSFEEAYPLESSYAVTGLVLFNLMYARLRYPHFFTVSADNLLQEIARRSVNFIQVTPETHGIIANHIATSELALAMYGLWRNQDLPSLTVFAHQNDEGWFTEYSGADPGYQSLLESYFSGAISAGLNLPQNQASLEKSRQFTTHFKLPSGSFAGEVGSRGTGIFYPGSLVLGASSEDVSWFESVHINFEGAVTPLTVDSGNFVPVFNSWALYRKQRPHIKIIEMPALAHKFYKNAGLIIHRSANEALIFSVRNCTWRHQVLKENSWRESSNAALVQQGLWAHSGNVTKQKGQTYEVQGHLTSTPQQKINTPFTTILLRLLAFQIYAFPVLQRTLKILLARFVMNKPSHPKGPVLIKLDCEGQINISYTPSELQTSRYGFSIHMASANSFERRGL